MSYSLATLDRLTQRFERSGTSLFIRTFDDSTLVHEFEFTDMVPGAPIPVEVSDTARYIRTELARNTAHFASADANGQVLRGVGGVGINLKKSRLSVELANINNVGVQPSGSEWLNSAARDLDTFTGYLQFEPTIFFDPDDTTSLNYGTEEEPYNTLVEVNRRMIGNQAGAVLGIKRGSRAYSAASPTGAAALLLECYGTAASPVMVVPYGDPTQPMPIIDCGKPTGTGTSYVWVVSSGSVWRTACAVNTDVFENGVRCLKKTTTPAAAGECQYDGTYLYYWPRSTSNPNDGSLHINYVQWGIWAKAPNVAAPNYIRVVGIDVRHARGNSARIAPGATNDSIQNGYGFVDFLFCRLGKDGYDDSNRANDPGGFEGSTTTISYNGVDATHRMGSSQTISSKVIGCELYDGTHHAVEHSQSDNGLMEHCYVHDIFGAPFEAYCDASGHTMRNNYCVTMSGYGRLDGPAQGSCALLYNFTCATYGGALAYDTTHALNVNNHVYNNFFKNVSQIMFACNGGSGHKIYNNTVDIDHDAIWPTGGNSNLPAGLSTDGNQGFGPTYTAGTGANVGFLTWSNNLLYYRYSPLLKASPGYANPTLLNTDGTTNGNNCPSGNNNCYFVQTGFGTANWQYGTTTQNFTTYKTAVASLDQASLCAYGTAHPIAGGSYGNTGGTTTVEALKYTEATGKPATSSPLIQGGANASANRLTDYIGQTVIAVATPAIGCYER